MIHVITFGIAWAQTTTAPTSAPAAGGGAAAAGFLVVIGLLLVIGIAVKLYDRKRKRDAEAVHLQAQISDALMRDAGLAGLLLTPTASIQGGVPVVDLTGDVPDEATHEAALKIAREEAARLRPDARIVDRTTVRSTQAA